MDYHPRYLAGIVLFNQQDFFEAHEVWEDLWAESTGDERRFYQGLIQAAVGLCHFGNGNLRGAIKLYNTSRAYMEGLSSPFLGLDTQGFWKQMAYCYDELHAATSSNDPIELDVERLPVISLDPPPEAWPAVSSYLHPDT